MKKERSSGHKCEKDLADGDHVEKENRVQKEDSVAKEVLGQKGDSAAKEDSAENEDPVADGEETLTTRMHRQNQANQLSLSSQTNPPTRTR